MTIPFSEVPSNLLEPFVAVEFNPALASGGSGKMEYRALLIGQKIGTGTAAANSLYKVTSADQVLTLAGRGSQLHRMAIKWFLNNKYTECWVGVLADNAAGVFASGSIVVAGPSTAAGTIDLYVAGEHLQVAVGAADSANTIAAAIAAAIGVHASGTITATLPDAADNVTVAGVTFVGTAGAVVPGEATYSIDTGSAEVGASLAAQINAHAVVGKLVRATAAATVNPAACPVTLRAIAGGTAGNAITLATTDAVKLTVSGATLTGGAAGQDESLPVHASVSTATVTLHAKNAGLCGNDIDVRVNYQDGEETPAGVTLTITEPTSGATNPLLTSLITAMGDRWYHIWAHPYTDATSLSAIETELARRFGAMLMIDGVAITSADGDQSTLSALGDTRNSGHSVIWSQPGANPLTPPAEFAAACAGVVAFHGNADPARPFQTLEVKGVLAPAEADLFTFAQRNTLANDGIATSDAAGGAVRMKASVTTYHTNPVGVADGAYRQINTMLTAMYLRYDFRSRIATKYPRHKLADDGTRIAAGQAVITPKIGKAEAVLWFAEKEEEGLVENAAQFKADLVVERDSTDNNRLNFLLSPDFINSFVVGAVSFAFRL